WYDGGGHQCGGGEDIAPPTETTLEGQNAEPVLVSEEPGHEEEDETDNQSQYGIRDPCSVARDCRQAHPDRQTERNAQDHRKKCAPASKETACRLIGHVGPHLRSETFIPLHPTCCA
ncbi:MAG: hypothetical protein JSU68_04930, partial [Phycisphaerales bacterium]